jgi:hypothetical protein
VSRKMSLRPPGAPSNGIDIKHVIRHSLCHIPHICSIIALTEAVESYFELKTINLTPSMERLFS